MFAAPALPLLFMGEEYGETTPLQFFTSFFDQSVDTKEPWIRLNASSRPWNVVENSSSVLHCLAVMKNRAETFARMFLTR